MASNYNKVAPPGGGVRAQRLRPARGPPRDRRPRPPGRRERSRMSPGRHSDDPREWRTWCAATTDWYGSASSGAATSAPRSCGLLDANADLITRRSGVRLEVDAGRGAEPHEGTRGRLRAGRAHERRRERGRRPRRRRDRRDDRRGRARPLADPHRAEVGQARGDREQGAARELRRRSCSRSRRPRASTCCSRRRSRAASR